MLCNARKRHPFKNKPLVRPELQWAPFASVYRGLLEGAHAGLLKLQAALLPAAEANPATKGVPSLFLLCCLLWAKL